MTDFPTINIDPDDIVRYLLYQQFYFGDDIIYGRNKDISEKVKGSGKAIDHFYKIITKKIELIDEGKYLDYLKFFNKKVGKIPVDQIWEKFSTSKNMLIGNIDRKIVLTLLVGEALVEIQKMCFNRSIEDLIENIRAQKGKEPCYILNIDGKIKDLFSRSDPSIGLIYNLSFLNFIGKKIKKKNIVKQTEKYLKKHFTKVLERLYPCTD